MRTLKVVSLAGLMVLGASSTFSELQDVTVGGSLRIRGNWYSQVSGATGFSDVSFNDNDPDAFYVEQRTRVNVDAEFTEDVRAFIELDRYDSWGSEFRRLDAAESISPGAPAGISPSSVSDSTSGAMALYQGYIEVAEIFGTPVTVRVGRQEIQVGSEFLVGNNDTKSGFTGLSFDGVTLQSQFGDFGLRSWYTLIAQNDNNTGRWENSGDIWFHGIQGSYLGFEDVSLEAYAMRYFQAHTDTISALGFTESIEFTTVGLRFAGSRIGIDWDVEGAYQFGDSGLPSPNDDISAYAAIGKVGYTFDIEYQPRVFVNGAYFSGDEENPAFQRLFSDIEFSEFLDAGDLSNLWVIGGGASAQVTESIGLTAVANYYNLVEDFGAPDDDLGVEVGLYATYAYTDDLTFSAGYAHLFVGDGLGTPQFTSGIGGRPLGVGTDDVNFVYMETSISF